MLQVLTLLMQQTLPVPMAAFASLEGAVGMRGGWRCVREGFGGLYVVEEGGTAMMLKLCADSWDSNTRVRYLYATMDDSVTTPVLTKAHFQAIVCDAYLDLFMHTLAAKADASYYIGTVK